MESNQNNYQEDEITLKDLIHKIQDYVNVILKNKWLIILFCIPTTAYFMYKHINYIPNYTAKLQFVVEGQGGVGGGIAGLLGQFGISRGEQSINPWKIVEVGRSPEITTKVVANKLSNGNLMGNELIDLYEFRERWAKSDNPEKQNFLFEEELKMEDRTQSGVFKSIYNLLWGNESNRNNSLMSIDFNEETGIFSITSTTKEENVSLILTKSTYNNLKYFFEEEILQNQKKSIEILKSKADSLNTLIKSKAYALGRFEDSNNGLLSGTRSLKGQLLQRELQALSLAYAETLRTYEMADYELLATRPLFKSISIPFGPLSIKTISLIFSIFKGVLFGLMLGMTYVIGKYIYQITME